MKHVFVLKATEIEILPQFAQESTVNIKKLLIEFGERNPIQMISDKVSSLKNISATGA